MKKAKKAKKAAAKKKKKKPAAPKGCCTISFTDRPDEQHPNVTEDKCDELARDAGGVGHWRKGACA